MEFNQLHFSTPNWLWALSVLPAFWIAYLIFYKNKPSYPQLEKYIDAHLLPYLINKPGLQANRRILKGFLWSFTFICLVVAMAGPRWNLREIETYSKDQSLVILLDLSESMNAEDTKPTRLIRAKQKIEDLINQSQGTKIGLIAFAADPHMISPLTDDKETVRHLLLSLETDLVYVQGSKLAPTLDMGLKLLENEPGTNKALLVISDGGFEDNSFPLKKIKDKGIAIHVMGVGTKEGSPMKDRKGNHIKKEGKLVFSKLEEDRLKNLAKEGGGRYIEANYSNDELAILEDLANSANNEVQVGRKKELWDEGFYYLLFPIIPAMLWWFRKGSLFSIIFFLPLFSIEGTLSHYFMNSDERGKIAFENDAYLEAADLFQDPYCKGVALYSAKEFEQAEKCFKDAARDNTKSEPLFNLGNTYVQQKKFKDAISAYEQVLEKWPDHIKAKENLELVKKMQENEKSQKNDQKDKQKGDEKNQDDKSNSDPDKKDSSSDETKKEGDDDNSSEKEKSDPKNGEQSPQDSEKEEPSDSKDEESKEPPKEQDRNEQDGKEQDETISDKEEEKEVESEERCARSQADQDADAWLNRIQNDPKTFLKNKFFIESRKNKTKEGVDPW